MRKSQGEGCNWEREGRWAHSRRQVWCLSLLITLSSHIDGHQQSRRSDGKRLLDPLPVGPVSALVLPTFSSTLRTLPSYPCRLLQVSYVDLHLHLVYTNLFQKPTASIPYNKISQL